MLDLGQRGGVQVVVLVAPSTFGRDESGGFEEGEVLGDGLAGRIESVLHGQSGADLEECLVVAVDELVEDGSTVASFNALNSSADTSTIGK